VAARAAAAAAALLIAAALAGCGPFGGEDADGTEPLDEQEFVQRGDAICRSAQSQVAELRREPPSTPQQSARFTEELIGVFEQELGELEALDPPPDQAAAFDRYLKAREEAIGFLEEGLAAAEREDAAAYAEAQADVAAGQVERAELARQAGFSECSRPLTEELGTSP
jgi:hypothetical protein